MVGFNITAVFAGYVATVPVFVNWYFHLLSSLPFWYPPHSLQISLTWSCSNFSCCPFNHCRYAEVRKSVVEPLLPEEMYTQPEMIDNPLYDYTKSKDKLVSKREQELIKAPRKELPSPPDQSFTKLQEVDTSKASNKQQSSPPFIVPTPRFRSYTCSAQSEEKTALNEKTQSKQKPYVNVDALVPMKKPVKLSRSEVGHSKPPLPSKSQMVLDMLGPKGRDYRESSELPHLRKHQNEDGTLSGTAVLVGCSVSF